MEIAPSHGTTSRVPRKGILAANGFIFPRGRGASTADDAVAAGQRSFISDHELLHIIASHRFARARRRVFGSADHFAADRTSDRAGAAQESAARLPGRPRTVSTVASVT